jgi:hypothetical protein
VNSKAVFADAQNFLSTWGIGQDELNGIVGNACRLAN